MIDFVRGTVAARGEDWVVLDVGGLGYRITVSGSTVESLPATGEVTQLHTVFHVREDAFSLYGFSEAAEKDMFQVLLGVSQVGPRVALSALGCLSPENLRNAVVGEDLDTLVRIPGVGRKTARRLVLELRDQMETLPGPTGMGDLSGQEVASALRALGYSGQEALEASRAAFDRLGPGAEAEDLVREGLRYLLDRSHSGRS